ncbi:MAG: hypothetical protein RML40_00525 [Bacteroidota bacterium]|nr:hypothetical protein [Candidatus Kapabacteria bacterium]MDW8218990.1 hypothetical protein [Bacteroidota bacterium]
MTVQELCEYIQQRIEILPGTSRSVVSIPDEVFWRITRTQAQEIVAHFGASVFLRLPESECHFFEWLKHVDYDVWSDLWDTDIPEGESNEPYLVSLGLLPEMVHESRGFPICDLITQTNFFFSIKSFNAEEIKPVIDAILQRIEDKHELSMKEILLMEIRRAPIDIWRFAYFYRLPVAEVKQMIIEFVDDGLLRHASSREDISDVLDWN